MEKEAKDMPDLRSREGDYRIDPAACTGCQSCRKVCPSGCILDTAPRVIDREHCIRCGNCFRACPVGAVERLD